MPGSTCFVISLLHFSSSYGEGKHLPAVGQDSSGRRPALLNNIRAGSPRAGASGGGGRDRHSRGDRRYPRARRRTGHVLGAHVVAVAVLDSYKIRSDLIHRLDV